ncbi:MAG TPA: GNAT family N-acetyltransferase [Anaerolineae bacterium]|nr:GNAT family N-acetyltransferase [Anaerolineae bacterium]HQI85787.1 GNAT family N-acetyltransferase [Anaerolineae bacterium]
MRYHLTPFTSEHLERAVALFQDSYRQEREHSPLLPTRALDDPAWIRDALTTCLEHPGVVVMQDDRLAAYMVTGAQFHWKGQNAALVPEYGHSATTTDKETLYQQMYMHLAQLWVDDRCHLHLIGHLAHDDVLRKTLYQLGFGAIVAERLRDLSPIDALVDIAIVQEPDVHRLADLELEHNRYYFRAPIFLTKDTDRSAMLADLDEHVQAGDVFFTYYEDGRPRANMIVGRTNPNHEGEGFLLWESNTAQIKGAYIQPDIRGKGIGAALLNRAIQWARAQGCARLFVEHETANFYGSRFWRKYFAPYVYFSMRYVDNTI